MCLAFCSLAYVCCCKPHRVRDDSLCQHSGMVGHEHVAQHGPTNIYSLEPNTLSAARDLSSFGTG